MFGIIDRIIDNYALNQYEKERQGERPTYGIVISTNIDYDENGSITKVHSVEVVYLQAGQLCNIVVSSDKVNLGDLPCPGMVVKFLSDQLYSTDIERKINSAYIVGVDIRPGFNYQEEVYELVRMYTENIPDDDLDPIFWTNLGLDDEARRLALVKNKNVTK
jgi:hypothetical protein